jgi:voltage-gated potassium channel
VSAYREEMRGLFSWEAHHRRLLVRLGIVLSLTALLDLCGTVAVYFAERHAAGTEIHSVGDALFFTTVQLLTVSSQLKNPLTVTGRVIDVILEVWAVLVVAGSAGAMADFFQVSRTKS